ncbi:FecR domain-containing protein [Aromatoleum aromaticum]|uniref:LysM domain-containing protein n=1 Tax=Aromatoleum aromaticum (strain DSM 19018 / LMG 30748 / EbN1) TaxID=76114 RepID=Q5P4J3_AROAE|nr:FecR domain-containing protein [Aromatoleum aromaticum]NMG53545.1 LysM peptidoglycan-binding domain-containing protein [Aromatoleum aromaticum]CAI07770.1 conserved hypothetical protein [Aromatoleum aromaticum EbN1]
MNPSTGTTGRPVSHRATAASLLAGITLLALPAVAAAEDFRYVVRPGDNPWNLTRRYLKSIDYWPRIQEYNQIQNPKAIPPGTILRIPVAWMRAEQGTARVVDVQGEAQLHREGAPVAITPGMALTRGTVIRTGEASSLLLEFSDGSRSLVGENSEVRVGNIRHLKASDAQQVELELRRGRLENEVEPARKAGGRYRIHTPAGVAAVRGTEFRVATSEAGMRAETLRGEVALRNRRGEVRLRAGTGSLATPGQAPQPPSGLLAAPQLETLPARIERLPFALAFPAIAGAQRYRTQLAPPGAPAAVASDRLGTAPAALGRADLADGTYRMRVRAIDARELEGLDAEREIVVDARPEPPYPNLPVQDGVAIDERIEFRWTRSIEPGHYHFQLAADEQFQTLLADRERLDEPGLVVDADLAPGHYYWRVALTTTDEGHGPFSDVQRLRRPPPGPAAEAGEVRGGRLELRWKSAGENARYELQLSRDAAFSTADFTFDAQQAALSIETPPPGVYYVRIRTLEPDGTAGPWGRPQQFDVPHNYWPALLLLVPLLLIL